MSVQSQKPVVGFPGYFEIPGFSNYAVDFLGNVINLKKRERVRGSRNPKGYHNYRLVCDDRCILTIGRHRVMCLAFKHPGVDTDNLVVNHLNGIKGDDWLNNLEWVTYQGNAEHAGANGLTEKCIPISVRDVETGQVIKYPSATEYARLYGMSKDAVLYRLKVGEHRVFPEKKQYRKSHSDESWYTPSNIDTALLLNGTSKSVLVRHGVTGMVRSFDQLTKLADYLQIKPSTLTQWMNQPDQPVLPGLVQLKWAHDEKPWRDVDDLYVDLERNSGKRVVKIKHVESGVVTVFETANECAAKTGLSPTALNYRLNSGRKDPFPDGFIYRYYADSF